MTRLLFAKPLVTIIVPTYNYGHFISDTLDNIQAQTYKNWECIVVDDGFVDDTRKIVQGFIAIDDRIRYFYQENQCQAVARNTGLKNSNGKYIQFLDADDLMEDRKLEHQVAFLEDHDEVDITYSSTRYFTTEDPLARWYFMHSSDAEWIPEVAGMGREIIKMIIGNNIMTINSPLMRRTVVDDVGFFDKSLKLVEDWDFWIRCALKGKYIQYKNWDDAMALVRSHSSSFSRNKKQVNQSAVLMREKLNKLIKDPDILLLNQQLLAELKEWMKNIDLTCKDLKTFIREDQSFILVDEDQLRNELLNFSVIPFIEKNGEYHGMPDTDQSAIQEYERLKKSGAEFIVFAWTSFWAIDFYVGLIEHTLSGGIKVLSNDRLEIFYLGNK